MGMSHIGKNHDEIVLRSAQEVGTKDDCEGFRSHLILFFKVGDPGRSASKRCQETKECWRVHTCPSVQILCVAS
jgi:hypothetical protein